MLLTCFTSTARIGPVPLTAILLFVAVQGVFGTRFLERVLCVFSGSMMTMETIVGLVALVIGKLPKKCFNKRKTKPHW